jgi:hypothetical protein
MLEPLVPPVVEPAVELLESVVLLAEPDALLSRPTSRGVLVSLELGLRIELSVEPRPLARRFDFIFVPCWLQSHLHLSSLPIVSVEDAMLRSEVLVLAEAPAWGIVLSVGDAVSLFADGVVAGDEVDSDPRSEVLLPAVVPACGIVLSVGEAVSFFVDWVVVLGRSSVVCAVTAGAASARARIEVAASFICASVLGVNAPQTWWRRLAGGTTHGPSAGEPARKLAGPEADEGGRDNALLPRQSPPDRAATLAFGTSAGRARRRSSSRSRRCAWRSGS